MKKKIQTISASAKKETSQNSKVFNKTKVINSLVKHRPMLSTVSQNCLEQSKKNIQNSFCSNKNDKEKKNTVLLTLTTRKIINQNHTKDSFNNSLFREQLNTSKNESSNDNDKKIDQLQSKIDFLFGIIQNFENDFINNNPPVNVKEELKSIKKYTKKDMDNSTDINDDKNISYKQNRLQNKSVEITSKTTMDNSVVTQRKYSEKKPKQRNNKININKKDNKSLHTPIRKDFGNTVNYYSKKKDALINKQKRNKNNSLCSSSTNVYPLLSNSLKQSLRKARKESIESYLEKTINKGNVVRIFFPESVNKEDKCKSARLCKKSNKFKLNVNI